MIDWRIRGSASSRQHAEGTGAQYGRQLMIVTNPARRHWAYPSIVWPKDTKDPVFGVDFDSAPSPNAQELARQLTATVLTGIRAAAAYTAIRGRRIPRFLQRLAAHGPVPPGGLSIIVVRTLNGLNGCAFRCVRACGVLVVYADALYAGYGPASARAPLAARDDELDGPGADEGLRQTIGSLLTFVPVRDEVHERAARGVLPRGGRGGEGARGSAGARPDGPPAPDAGASAGGPAAGAGAAGVAAWASGVVLPPAGSGGPPAAALTDAEKERLLVLMGAAMRRQAATAEDIAQVQAAWRATDEWPADIALPERSDTAFVGPASRGPLAGGSVYVLLPVAKGRRYLSFGKTCPARRPLDRREYPTAIQIDKPAPDGYVWVATRGLGGYVNMTLMRARAGPNSKLSVFKSEAFIESTDFIDASPDAPAEALLPPYTGDHLETHAHVRRPTCPRGFKFPGTFRQLAGWSTKTPPASPVVAALAPPSRLSMWVVDGRYFEWVDEWLLAWADGLATAKARATAVVTDDDAEEDASKPPRPAASRKPPARKAASAARTAARMARAPTGAGAAAAAAAPGGRADTSADSSDSSSSTSPPSSSSSSASSSADVSRRAPKRLRFDAGLGVPTAARLAGRKRGRPAGEVGASYGMPVYFRLQKPPKGPPRRSAALAADEWARLRGRANARIVPTGGMGLYGVAQQVGGGDGRGGSGPQQSLRGFLRFTGQEAYLVFYATKEGAHTQFRAMRLSNREAATTWVPFTEGAATRFEWKLMGGRAQLGAAESPANVSVFAIFGGGEGGVVVERLGGEAAPQPRVVVDVDDTAAGAAAAAAADAPTAPPPLLPTAAAAPRQNVDACRTCGANGATVAALAALEKATTDELAMGLKSDSRRGVAGLAARLGGGGGSAGGAASEFSTRELILGQLNTRLTRENRLLIKAKESAEEKLAKARVDLREAHTRGDVATASLASVTERAERLDGAAVEAMLHNHTWACGAVYAQWLEELHAMWRDQTDLWRLRFEIAEGPWRVSAHRPERVTASFVPRFVREVWVVAGPEDAVPSPSPPAAASPSGSPAPPAPSAGGPAAPAPVAARLPPASASAGRPTGPGTAFKDA